ncbi:adenosine deaminase [Listeria sp. FSL L7-0091]|uniref:adenosine deaminase n=1 Tax=Listeria farberi TaxID=2713500 RepID=UPI00162539FA|nr:adenosine deaminase [Listeria farberi]MBC2260376.1 adenosine deaminase [Listeria farberi]MBC2266728.1 adenosine deaminase [Listeria farberi]
MNEQQVKKIPKVELHCHLDGSIRLKTLRKLYELQGNPLMLSEEKLQRMTVAANRCSLTEYINCFRLVSAGLHTKEAIYLALLDLAEQAALENIIYIEIRLSPIHLVTTNFSMEEVAETLIDGSRVAEKVYSIKIGLIFCCMRRQSEQANLAVIDVAKKYLGKEVVAIDLAGDEGKYPTKDYQSLFSYASRIGMPYTIHAGETGDLTSVLLALEFGARRIGHGIALAQSKKVMERAAKQQVLLEMCPVCNIQTGAAQNWQSYPVELFHRNGIQICFNTDNRTVSNTTLTNEYLQVNQNSFTLSAEWILRQTEIALDYSFIDEDSKRMLKEKLILPNNII